MGHSTALSWAAWACLLIAFASAAADQGGQKVGSGSIDTWELESSALAWRPAGAALQAGRRRLRKAGGLPGALSVELSQDVAIPLRNLTALGAGRMAGGVNAKAGQFPFVALLTVSEGGNRYSECTATLISSTVLLTAAHCVKGAKSATVQIGMYDQDKGGVEEIRGASVKWSSDYTGKSGGVNENDVGLVILSRPAKTAPASLPYSQVKAGTLVTIAGWGVTSQKAKDIPRYLQVQNFPLLSSRGCYSAGQILRGKMLCLSWARTAQAGTTTCSGDSGAGLFVGSTVVGTISGGSGSCGSRMGASLAVRTADWITWIKKYSS